MKTPALVLLTAMLLNMACSKVTCDSIMPGHAVWQLAAFPDSGEGYLFVSQEDTLQIDLLVESIDDNITHKCGISGALTDCLCLTYSVQAYGNEQFSMVCRMVTTRSENVGGEYEVSYEIEWENRNYHFSWTINENNPQGKIKAMTEPSFQINSLTLYEVVTWPEPELTSAEFRLFIRPGQGVIAMVKNSIYYHRIEA